MAVPTFRNAKSVYPPFRPSYISPWRTPVARGPGMESLKFIHESGRKLPRRKHSLRQSSSSCFIVAVEEIRTRWKKIDFLGGQKSWNRKFRGETWVEDYRPGQGRGKIEVSWKSAREVWKQESCGRRSMEGLTIIFGNVSFDRCVDF